MPEKNKLPTFEVEFIPAERRWNERRHDPLPADALPQDKRHSRGRREEDLAQQAQPARKPPRRKGT